MSEAYRKFYPIIGRGLGIALEATFYLDLSSKLQLPDDPKFKSLVYSDPAHFLVRFYFPAMVAGDVSAGQRQTISFTPWVDRSQAAFHRICLRARKDRQTRSLQWLSLARMSEDKDFCFEPVYDKGEAYISLDFFSKRRNEFLPVFVRVRKQEGKGFDYFVVESEGNSEDLTKEVVLTVKAVKKSEAPPPWVSLQDI